MDDIDLAADLIKALNLQDPREAGRIREFLGLPEIRPLLLLQQLQAAMHTLLITDRMPGGFFIYQADSEEKILYANQAVCRLFGCKDNQELRELTHNSFRGIVHPEDYQAVEESIRRQIAESRHDLDYVEYRIVQKDGTVRWVEDYGHFVHSESAGDLFYVFIADATDRRQAQMEERAAALESINQELRRRLKIIEGFSVGYESIFYADLDADLVHPYQISSRGQHYFQVGQAARYTGFDTEYIQTWVHPEDRDMVRAATDVGEMRRRLATSKSYHLNYRIVDAGRTVYFQLLVSTVGGRDGVGQVVMGYRSVDEDVRKELEQRRLLTDALKKANAAAEAKDTFLSNISHTLRTPLNTVLGYTALARKNLGDPEKLDACLTQIEQAGNQLHRLIGDVLELSQFSGPEQLQEEPCDLLAILHSVQSAALPLANEKSIQLSQSFQGLHDAQVYVDRRKLEQALLRLISNAVKYTPAGGHVRLSVTEQGAPTRDYATYIFQVEDDGIGIKPEDLKRIFSPERTQDAAPNGMVGMGLGLTIVRTMVELMGGTLTAQSHVDQGSCFTVSLTLRVQTAAAPLPETAGSSLHGRILLAEDNDINRELGIELLEDAGFQVESAENGKVAVEKIAASKPGDFALVLMDIQMPVMDGNEAARAIRALPDPALASIPIMALSANSLETDRKKSVESGMNAHLSKPIQIDQLTSFLKRFAAQQEDSAGPAAPAPKP